MTLFRLYTQDELASDGYPYVWRGGAMQKAIRAKAQHRCEDCGMCFHIGTNKAVIEVNRDGKSTIGTVHHINENKADCRYENLVSLCQRCRRIAQAWRPGEFILIKWKGS